MSLVGLMCLRQAGGLFTCSDPLTQRMGYSFNCNIRFGRKILPRTNTTTYFSCQDEFFLITGLGLPSSVSAPVIGQTYWVVLAKLITIVLRFSSLNHQLKVVISHLTTNY